MTDTATSVQILKIQNYALTNLKLLSGYKNKNKLNCKNSSKDEDLLKLKSKKNSSKNHQKIMLVKDIFKNVKQ